jgi:hypothetical protein
VRIALFQHLQSLRRHHSPQHLCGCLLLALTLLQVGAATSFEEADGQVVTVSCLEGKPRNVFEKWDAAKWRLNSAWQQALQRATGAASSSAAS